MKHYLYAVVTASILLVSACGGGGGSSQSSSSSSSESSSSSSSESSSSSSSESSSSSSSESSSSSSSESSSSSVANIPNAASNNKPYCRDSSAVPENGWGWETGATCIGYLSAADPGVGNYDYCLIGAESIPFCSTETGDWGYEDAEVCLSQSLCPGFNSGQQTALSETLVNPNADATAKKVYTYLKSVWGSKMLSGQQDLTWNDSVDMYQRVINDTNKAPAIMGYDFMNYAYSGGSGQQQTEEAIVHWDRGGLVTFAWHWRVGSEVEFYSEKTDFEIPILNGELNTSSADFTALVDDIDDIAAELQTLEDAGVTVLWRPLHEAAGGWFWWGRTRTDGVPAGYAQALLWQYMYDRMTNHHGLNNLIWVWNGQSLSWYPGNDYVDIVSHDIYAEAKNYGSQIGTYNIAKAYPTESKLVALSENSNIPDPDAMEADGAWWLYFVVWNDSTSTEGVTDSNNFWTGEYFNTNAHKNHVYNHSNVITLDELPSF